MLSDFTGQELKSTLELVLGYSVQYVSTPQGEIFKINYKSHVIIINKTHGWVSFMKNIPTRAIKGSEEYNNAFKWKLNSIRELFPKHVLEVKNHYNVDSVVSCLRFKLSTLADLETLSETIRAAFHVISLNLTPRGGVTIE